MGTVVGDRELEAAKLDLGDLDSLVPADSVSVRSVGTRHTDPGIGVPMVGWISAPEKEDRRYEFAPPTGVPLSLTVWLDFDQDIPTWRMVYPGRVPNTTVAGRTEPLAADWSAANAFYWQMSDLDDLDIAKVIIPSRFIEETDLYLATPYDPEKIPVIFVHGLNSSPGTFKQMFNELQRHAWFRENYQAWFFSYPTGTSWIYNAARFRAKVRAAGELAASRNGSDTWDDMVLVSHSMGGVISHASLVDPGTRFYDLYFDEPLPQVDISVNGRQAIERLLLYEPLAAPERVIFLATPHQGAPLATRLLPNLLSNLIKLPKRITIDVIQVTLAEIGNAFRDGARPLETSIGTLSPAFGGFEAMNASPWRDDLKRHSIIGEWQPLGLGPFSSDGVVPDWSSRIEPVQSEITVSSFHDVTKNLPAIQEVSAILKLHLREQ